MARPIKATPILYGKAARRFEQRMLEEPKETPEERERSGIMKKSLTVENLIESAKVFCDQQNSVWHSELFGVTDGKAIGTFVEQLFKSCLEVDYDFDEGNSASGIDFPSINTDIKVTSIDRPQSSCPYKDSKQKIYGLGYNIILFVYEKSDDKTMRKGHLQFLSCTFIAAERTADYQTTTGLLNIIRNNANTDDVVAFLSDRNLPGDEVTLSDLAREILENPPKEGYLTISNALQWRLKYSRVVSMTERVEGIVPIIRLSGAEK